MAVRLTPVSGKRELKQFIYLPERLHNDHPLWMPPLYMDEWDYLNPKKNRAFGYCDTTMVLAEKDGKLVGRVMGIINRRHNEKMKELNGRFALFESTDDQEVAHALLSHVENWARSKGMTRVVGPFGFTDQDPEGFQIDGFEHHPSIVTYYNFPHIIRLLEAEGYGKETDYVVYKLPRANEVPPLMGRIAERAERAGFREVNLRKKSEIKGYIVPILQVMNETYQGIYGYSPLDDQEMHDLAKKYLIFLDIRFLKIVVKDGEVVAFMVAMPDLYDAFVKSRGHLFPFGWIHFVRETKRSSFKQLDILLIGITGQHRGKGLDMLMQREMLKSAIAAGVEHFESHHELETNTLVRAETERQGGRIYKRYRIFQKTL